MPTLYRGIAVPHDKRDAVVRSIREHGLYSPECRWKNVMPAPALVRAQTAALAERPGDVRQAITAMPSSPMIYACGDKFGACHYAFSHNRSADYPASMLIELEVPWEALCVDGKDFLYTVFQFWDRGGTERRGAVRNALGELYGEGILPYFDAAASKVETQERIGICDLACHDVDVIHGHYANRCLILGRHGTEYCSSFQFQSDAAKVKDIDTAPVVLPRPRRQITLEGLVH